jgi:thiol-disulfide isomerase/thioredoxin
LRLAPVLLSALAVCSPGGERVSGSDSGSDAAPARSARVEVVDLDGLVTALEARKGKPYLLNVWAIWCAPCVAELPELVETAHAWRGRGGDVVTLNYDLMMPDVTPEEVREQVRAFVAERGWDLDVWVFQGLDYDAINARLDLPGPVPVTLAFDAQGREVGRAVGQADRARFEELMRVAVGAP